MEIPLCGILQDFHGEITAILLLIRNLVSLNYEKKLNHSAWLPDIYIISR
jgi:hypothetical protein